MIERLHSLTDEQIEQLHALYQREWWSEGRSLADVRRMLDNTDIAVAFVEQPSGNLVAFGRLLTDFMYHATLYDVIVAEGFRSKGLARRLMEAVLSHRKLDSVPCIWLCCLPEMVPFYQKWGFETTESDMKWMRWTRKR